MPTEKPRITFTLDEDTLKAIDDYKFKNRIKNQSQAILSLIEIGMDSLMKEIKQKEKAPESYVSETAYATPEERELLSLYNQMNDDGKKLLLSTARTYAGNPAMQKESSCEEAI